jgi:hypothetical protein
MPRDADAVRITTAAASRQADISARQRRYVVSMGIRTLCFLAAIAVGPGWLRWVLFAAAVVLPYVAVVMANAASNRRDDFALMGAGPSRPELDRGGDPDDQDDI